MTAITQETVAVPRAELVEIASLFNGLELVFSALAGNVCPTPVSNAIFDMQDLLDRLLGIEHGEDREHESNPDWLTYDMRGDLIAAELLDAIVADPDEDLVPRDVTRAELAQQADKLREIAQRDKEHLDRVQAGKGDSDG